MTDTAPEGVEERRQEGDGERRRHDRRRSDRHRTARVVLISVIASGLVSLALINIMEVQADNRQAERSRLNCESANDDRRDTALSLDEQADRILGDMTKADGDPDEKTPPFRFEGTAFESFKPILLAQAQVNRERSRAWTARIQHCEDVFPKRKTLGFIE